MVNDRTGGRQQNSTAGSSAHSSSCLEMVRSRNIRKNIILILMQREPKVRSSKSEKAQAHKFSWVHHVYIHTTSHRDHTVIQTPKVLDLDKALLCHISIRDLSGAISHAPICRAEGLGTNPRRVEPPSSYTPSRTSRTRYYTSCVDAQLLRRRLSLFCITSETRLTLTLPD
jgi:hypothetical protein